MSRTRIFEATIRLENVILKSYEVLTINWDTISIGAENYDQGVFTLSSPKTVDLVLGGAVSHSVLNISMEVIYEYKVLTTLPVIHSSLVGLSLINNIFKNKRYLIELAADSKIKFQLHNTGDLETTLGDVYLKVIIVAIQ